MPSKKTNTGKGKRKNPRHPSAGGGNNPLPVSATTHGQNTLLLLEKERQLDENTRQIELLIAIKKAIIERENKISPEENCSNKTLENYTKRLNRHRLDPKIKDDYLRQKQDLEDRETNILVQIDELGITDSEQEPYIDDYDTRVRAHKIRIEEALNKLDDKRQADSEEILNLPDRLTELLDNDIFKEGESPKTVRELVGLEKKLNDTFTAFKPINDTISALELELQLQLQLQHKFLPVEESELTSSPNGTSQSTSPVTDKEICSSSSSSSSGSDGMGKQHEPEKRKAARTDGKSSPGAAGLFRSPTLGSLMDLAEIERHYNHNANP